MIARRPDLEPKFYAALRESFGSQAREGVHLSGLLTPRKEFFQHAIPKPLTDEELGYFTAGRGHEDALTRFLGKHFISTPEMEIDGIHLRPDFQAITSEVIPIDEHAEFKTRRSNLPEDDAEAATEFSSYRGQVRGYMALKRRRSMFLVVLSLVEGKTADALSKSSPVFAIYEETMTDDELEAERQKLYARRDSLQRAIAMLDGRVARDDEYTPAGVLDPVTKQARGALALELMLMPLCEEWMCGKAYPEIKAKAVCETCGQEFESAEFGPAKHVASKKGAGHVVKPAVVEWKYTPRCKWYGECRPFETDPTRGAR